MFYTTLKRLHHRWMWLQSLGFLLFRGIFLSSFSVFNNEIVPCSVPCNYSEMSQLVSVFQPVFSIFLLLYSLSWPAQLWWSLLLSWLFLVCNLDLACGCRGNQCLARNRNRQQRGEKHVCKRASFLGGLEPKCMWRRLEEEVHITVPTSTIKSLSPHHHSILTLACSACISIMGWTWLSLLLTYSCTICLWKEAARQFQRNLLLTENWCSGRPDP
jgi:hypothetical protein